MYNHSSSSEIYMPPWVILRLWPWIYTGVIVKGPITSGPDRITSEEITFEQLVEEALRSDHGEIREVDHYEQGVACWYKELDQKPTLQPNNPLQPTAESQQSMNRQSAEAP